VEFQYRTDMKNGIVEIGTKDVAELYSVETKRVNEAVKNNPDKFPHGYVIELTKDEASALRSKKSTLELGKKFADENFDRKSAISSKTRYYPKAFTERGLYMLATILKGSQAVETTIAIIDTFVQMREMARKPFSIRQARYLPRSLAEISPPSRPRRKSNSTLPW